MPAAADPMTPLDPPAATRGYTLPVWLAAAARAATGVLAGQAPADQVPLQLLEPVGVAQVPVEAAAPLLNGWVLGQSRCDPGDGLDLTRGLLIWVLARWRPQHAASAPAHPADLLGDAAASGEDAAVDAGQASPGSGGQRRDESPQEASAGTAAGAGETADRTLDPIPLDRCDSSWLDLQAGEGVGIHAASGEACLSTYARQLLAENLRPLVPQGAILELRVVLPAGRRLAERTSNAAFGVVEGLALIGTRAAVQAGASPDQLEATLAELERRCADPAFAGDLVLVIGENGLDLAPRLGLPADLLLKCGNWIGPVLVAAAGAGVRRLLLFGYQGKLLKLAGGIFHTHHHLADGRAAVLTAYAALEGLAGEGLAALHAAPTVEAALAALEQADPELADRLRQRLAAAIETSAAAYLHRHGAPSLALGAALFDRGRRLRVAGPIGTALLADLRSPRPSQAGGPEGDH
ncbi:MAG: cobalt-precorrin-5B (C(1))-methyltransferase [Cyanobium sp.]